MKFNQITENDRLTIKETAKNLVAAHACVLEEDHYTSYLWDDTSIPGVLLSDGRFHTISAYKLRPEHHVAKSPTKNIGAIVEIEPGDYVALCHDQMVQFNYDSYGKELEAVQSLNSLHTDSRASCRQWTPIHQKKER